MRLLQIAIAKRKEAMKNIGYVMLLSVFAVTIGFNTSVYAQRERQISTAERRDLDEERQNERTERQMSTAERRDLQQERQERTERIHREIQERHEQLERERQQQHEQQHERQMSTAERRDLEEERRNERVERQMSTAERLDLQQERQERTEQIRRNLQQRYEQLEQQRQGRLGQQQPFPSRGNNWTENNPYGQFIQPNGAEDTAGRNYHGRVLNEAEISLYRQNPRLAYKIYEVEENAVRETVNRFPNMAPHNTPADAFRHAYASALLARDIGAYNARYVTNLHEMTVNNPTNERDMDLSNNSVGIRIGSSWAIDRYGYRRPLTDKEMADATEQALRNGDLVFLQNR
jgi:hypothetical protein